MGGFFSAIGDQQQVQQQQRIQGLYTQQAYNDKDLGSIAAADALRRGVQQQGFVDLKTGQVRGAQTAGYAASGVDAGVGSAADAAAGTAGMSEYDKAIIGNNAAREAWGYNIQGQRGFLQGLINAEGANYAAQNAVAKMGGDNASGLMSLMSFGMGFAGGAGGGGGAASSSAGGGQSFLGSGSFASSGNYSLLGS